MFTIEWYHLMILVGLLLTLHDYLLLRRLRSLERVLAQYMVGDIVVEKLEDGTVLVRDTSDDEE
jgi:hypothetical protein